MELSVEAQDVKQGNHAALVEQGLRGHSLIQSASISVAPEKFLGTLGVPKNTPGKPLTTRLCSGCDVKTKSVDCESDCLGWNPGSTAY